MDVRYEISELFDMAFGIKSPSFIPFPISIGRGVDRNAKYSDVSTRNAAPATSMSWMGTPILYPFSLIGKTYQTYDLIGKLTDLSLNDFTMPAATLVDFSRPKNIVSTQVLGSQGTVKELYGFDDWKIRIRGLCLDEPGRTAKSQKIELLKWEQICGSISVSGELFSERYITDITIVSMNFSQLEKQPYVFPFEIEAVSDTAIELMFL